MLLIKRHEDARRILVDGLEDIRSLLPDCEGPTNTIEAIIDDSLRKMQSALFPAPPKKKRDSQRGRVYSAEDKWAKTLGDEKVMGLDEIRDLAFKMCESRGQAMVIHVRDGRGCRAARARRGLGYGVLTLPLWSRKMSVVCHEVAHLLTIERPAHCHQFCRNMISLVRDFMGPHEAARLVEEFKRARVRLHV